MIEPTTPFRASIIGYGYTDEIPRRSTEALRDLILAGVCDPRPTLLASHRFRGRARAAARPV